MLGIILDYPFAEEEEFPTRHDKSHVQREDKIIVGWRRMDGLTGHEVCVKRLDVLVTNVGEVIIGESGIQMPTPGDPHPPALPAKTQLPTSVRSQCPGLE